MLPYLIAGVIGYGISKLFEDNKAPKYNDGGLVAPNGKPSNLTPEQYKLVRTPAFKDWFGDWENDPENASKVVDENGEPLVVYHGTTKDFYVFKKADKYRKEWGIRDYGMYFSNSEFTAKEYSLDYEYKTDEYQEWNNKLEEYKKQQDWESWKKLYVEKKDQFSKDYSKKYKSIRVIKCFLNIRNAFIVEGNENYWYKVLKGTTDIAIDNKNDGIIALNIKEVFEDVQNTYVVFEPEQIKLADGSNTTFDSNNPDIRYAGGGSVEELKFSNKIESDAMGYEIGEYLYHITPVSNFNTIINIGFIPKNGISINGLPFENRLYFATSLISAYDLSVNFGSYRDDAEYVIFKIKSDCIDDYEEDNLFAHGIYVDYRVSNKCIVGYVNANDLFNKFDDEDLDNLYY